MRKLICDNNVNERTWYWTWAIQSIEYHGADFFLTHWGRVTHICVSKQTIIGSDNGLWPGQCHAIIWTNAGILLIGTLGTNFSEILSKIHTFSWTKMHLKMLFEKWLQFRFGLDVLNSLGPGNAYNIFLSFFHTDKFVIFNYRHIALVFKQLQYGAVITRSIFSDIFTKDSLPIRARYGLCFVDPASDWHSASVPVIIYVISYNIGPHYNNTRLYVKPYQSHLYVYETLASLSLITASTGVLTPYGTVLSYKIYILLSIVFNSFLLNRLHSTD